MARAHQPPMLVLCDRLSRIHALPSALRERLADASCALGGAQPLQPHGSPIDDLGVRMFPDRGRWLMRSMCEAIFPDVLREEVEALDEWDCAVTALIDAAGLDGLKPRPAWDVAAAVDAHAWDDVDAWLAAYAGPIGLWADARVIAGIVHDRRDGVRERARLLTRAATALAADGDERARDLFDIALAAWQGDSWEQFLVGLRAAAGEVKRFGATADTQARERALVRARELAWNVAGERQHWACGLSDNLEALVEVRGGADDIALERIQRAAQCFEDAPDPASAESRQAKWELYIQVLVNEITMLGKLGDWEAARRRCIAGLRGVDIVRAAFQLEIHAMLALTELNRGNGRAAYRSARAATHLADTARLPRQAAQAAKLRAVASGRLGNTVEAEAWAEVALEMEAV